MNTTLTDFILPLLNIIFLDLILAGDNAIVIGLAARNLRGDTQKKAILLGTGGAIILRIIATILVVWLLKVPWLLLFGGLLLILIAYKLLTGESNEEADDIQAGGTLWAAVRTIIVADAAMGLDNVIAIAGAANHNITLVVVGLLISVPIVVWGSTLFIKLINRYPWIIYIGSAVLGYTASTMITGEKKLEPFFSQHPVFHVLFIVLVIAGILAAGHWKRHFDHKKVPHSGTSG